MGAGLCRWLRSIACLLATLAFGARLWGCFQRVEQQLIAALIVVLIAHRGETITIMPSEPNALKTLRKYYGDRASYDGAEDTRKEYETANDRSVIISLAAVVDSALEYRLALAMPVIKTGDEELFMMAFRAEGPMGGFSYKTELCYYLGLIDERLRVQIDCLRSIRNAVAHTHRIVTFSNKSLQTAAKRLFAPSGYFVLRDTSPDGYRKAFIAEAGLIQPIIVDGRDAAVDQLRAAYKGAGMEPPF